LAALAVSFVGSGGAWAQTKGAAASGEGLAAFLRLLTERLDFTFAQLPEVWQFFKSLTHRFDLRELALLVGIFAAGLAAEWLARQLLVRVRHRIHGHGTKTPLRSLMQVMLLDGLALVALWIAARAVVSLLGEPQSHLARLGHALLLALVYWRGFNFVFRAWLRPGSPGGRLAPVDDATAHRLLAGLNIVIVLPLVARVMVQVLSILDASAAVTSAAAVLFVPFISGGLVWVVWHWRHDMAAWFEGMINPKDVFRAGKASLAQSWWVGGLVFYIASGLLAVYAALTQQGLANTGFTIIESMLLLLLLFETLTFGVTRHLPMEAPTVGEVLASCARLAVRLWVAVTVARAVMVGTLGAMTPEEWLSHDRAAKLAAVSALALFVAWRIVKYRMDRYIADNPLPTAGFAGDADDDAPATASRLRTIMPVLRVTFGVTFLVVGGLLILSELGVNITPLIAGASVLGLAVSFGSQSLVRDIVSGVFFLAEDSFRVGEYIDGSKVKGTVEGFSVRSIRLRHQNGQLHIVPFGQLTHITNFSRDWTTVKFSLSFAINTDVELLRKTAKKIGMDMMNEPQFQKELIQPPKMQGIVDIKDGSLIVRFKFTAKPNNPSVIQRTVVRRMFDQLPKLGIEFAKPPYATFPFGGLDPAARAAAQ
jgi:small-conductance mechanosensitive channel